ncbi:hypothetical protein ASPZODRAFT_133860 [Penicilliopsis zonata CBS 506.65]|uniref:tripeptidyl-peptidase II n=1 Tax=Penicilliopsis zonata CBS 506.65 TaxID=1073090 RepID=A0A1L9SDH1_9EURO|nr:hypothetical protein ASPZODRAFT_133860 [Penicilliopsis zonata CBS 506.65]OJJ45231.1 hypothetical protein ASPZODRAFT_133860 [Penicilliopsis zonata CBS 506.65]
MAFLYALLLAAPCLASVVLEQVATVPADWKLVKQADPSDNISLSVALSRQNLDLLESTLLAVSTPGSDSYGQFLDVDEVETRFPLANDTAVVSWLKEAGVTQISRQGGLVNFATSVETANSLLNTTFAVYAKGGSRKTRTTQYSVPEDLVGDIELIAPTVFFGRPIADRSVDFQAADTSVAAKRTTDVCEKITPDCLKEQYNISDYTPLASSGSRIGFGSFLNESALYSDLDLFTEHFGIPEQNFTVETINGGVNNQTVDPEGEADLDVQSIVGISHPLPVTEFITGGSPPYIPDAATTTDENEPYLPYYEYLMSKSNADLPLVISNSYGDDEQTVPFAYATRVCNLIGLMGIRGISILESSGDAGLGEYCFSNDGTNSSTFIPTFPASCPYITVVGGTQDIPEEAWVDGAGGFSNYFPRPVYQNEQVERYLNNYLSSAVKEYYTPYTNFLGRAFPDVSAFAGSPYYQIYTNGVLGSVAGTSGACPVFAAVVALLNDARLRAGKPQLGFLNPWLYSAGYEALNDITLGGSEGCKGNTIPWASWNATAGWDPATGLGTPNFEKMKAAVLNVV